MSEELLAKPVIKNKYWIVEKGTVKIGTIQTIDEINGGVVYVHNDVREKFTNIKSLSLTHNIKFGKQTDKAKSETYDVYGFPSCFNPYNTIYDVKRKVPLFTKSKNSKSFYCAGHYLIKFSGEWITENCPKSITISRYEYKGPFKTVQEAKDYITCLKT
tara:strand:+ start:4690 stop:5166 length:477 start_codon:yes stop_codon:yes gene_type:complete